VKIITGELFDSKDSTILITTNSFVKYNGELVMGRGAALQLKTMYPGLAKIFGGMINRYIEINFDDSYGIFVIVQKMILKGDPQYVGIFQVKHHFKEPASLDLIENSTKKAIEFFGTTSKVSMNFPGIGYGQLPIEVVLPIVEKLPNNFTLYLKG
jgi:hypothetical protein